MLQARYVRQRFPRHVHETYCIGVIEDGAQRFYRSGGGACGSQGETSFSSMPMMCIPDAPNWKTAGLTGPFILIPICSGLYPRDIRQPEGSVPWFPDAVLHDPGLAQQLMMTFTLLAQPGNTLFKETMLMSSLTG